MFKQLLSLIGFVLLLAVPVSFAEESVSEPAKKEFVQAGGADFWRQIRAGEMGYTTSLEDEGSKLINVEGNYWEIIRNRWISPLGLLFLGGSILGITLYYLFFGRVELAKPRSGKKMKRWSGIERAMHWFTAISFVILGLSGVLLFYGRHFLKPVVPEAFWGNVIYGAKIAHNYIGPLFAISLFLMILKWFKYNYFTAVDREWFRQGGGLVSRDKHPDAGFCNGGEKVWFWLITTVGSLVTITGLIMDFPMFGQTRFDMQIANLIHGFASLGLFAIAFGHIYIGTLGTEGAFEGMATGYVDETWAKQHHNLWYNEVKHQQEKEMTLSETDPSAEKPQSQDPANPQSSASNQKSLDE